LFQLPPRERAGDVLLAQQRIGRPRSAADGCEQDKTAPRDQAFVHGDSPIGTNGIRPLAGFVLNPVSARQCKMTVQQAIE
jgi:hypothetical protein